jgi:hypothetical protein
LVQLQNQGVPIYPTGSAGEGGAAEGGLVHLIGHEFDLSDHLSGQHHQSLYEITERWRPGRKGVGNPTPPKNSCCFGCFLPTIVCSRSRTRRADGYSWICKWSELLLLFFDEVYRDPLVVEVLGGFWWSGRELGLRGSIENTRTWGYEFETSGFGTECLRVTGAFYWWAKGLQAAMGG